MAAQLKTAVLGATGYAGFELTPVVAPSPAAEAVFVAARGWRKDGGSGGVVSGPQREWRLRAGTFSVGRLSRQA
jgi:hypothetical protein